MTIRKIERELLVAELATLESLLASVPDNDPVSKVVLGSRREDVQEQLQNLDTTPQNQAAVALYFGGKPVVGTRAIQAEFATSVLASFQELVSKLWMSGEHEQLPKTGPLEFSAGSQLHITSVVHGSFGFVLEEIADTEVMFPSPLKQSVEHATKVLEAFAEEDESQFADVIEELDPRALPTIRTLFKQIRKDEATVRVVEGEIDRNFDRTAIERAYARAESSDVDEIELSLDGELLGLIPIARRFEFKPLRGDIISGKVASTLSEAYLEKLHREPWPAGKLWRAQLRRRQIKRFNKRTESYFLHDLAEIKTGK